LSSSYENAIGFNDIVNAADDIPYQSQQIGTWQQELPGMTMHSETRRTFSAFQTTTAEWNISTKQTLDRWQDRCHLGDNCRIWKCLQDREQPWKHGWSVYQVFSRADAAALIVNSFPPSTSVKLP